MIYILNVTGTLINSGESLKKEEEEFLLEWIENKKVYLTSSLSYNNLVVLLGKEILKAVTRVFSENGSSVYHRDEKLSNKKTVFPSSLLDTLKEYTEKCDYQYKSTNSIVVNDSTIIYSPVGLTEEDQTKEKLELFKLWDFETHQFTKVRLDLDRDFPDFEVLFNSDGNLVITHYGDDKSQILNYIPDLHEQKIILFSDMIQTGGDDYKIAKIIKHINPLNSIHQISDSSHTYSIIDHIYK